MSAVIDPPAGLAKRIGEKHRELSELADLYEAFAPIVCEHPVRVREMVLTREQVKDKLRHGIAALQDEQLEFDIESFGALVARLAKAVEDLGSRPRRTKLGLRFFGDDQNTAPHSRAELSDGQRQRAISAKRIRTLIENDTMDAGRLLACASTADISTLSKATDEREVDAQLLWMLCQHALRRGYVAAREQIASLIGSTNWRLDYCYVCGADALLAELQGDQAEKHLRCGQCGADWKIPRLQCVHCASDDQNALRVLYAEGERETARVQGCDSCHRYIKLIASYSPAPPEMLPLLDLLSIDLDYVALDHSYRRGRTTLR